MQGNQSDENTCIRKPNEPNLKEDVKLKVLKLTSIAANQYLSRLTYVQLCMACCIIYIIFVIHGLDPTSLEQYYVTKISVLCNNCR